MKWAGGVYSSIADGRYTGLFFIAAFAALGPLLAPHDPIAQDLLRFLEPPTATHPLGLDHLGRDILSRLLHGAPLSIGFAALSVAMAGGIGSVLGIIAARGGLLAAIILRLGDIFLAFPGMLLAILLAGLAGGGLVPMLIGLNLAIWPQFARLARGVAAGVFLDAHVQAARLAGFASHEILIRHVAPPVVRHLAPLAALSFGAAVMAIVSLGFLGLGIQPPAPEWGAMVNELFPHAAEAPVQFAAPCLAIFVCVLLCFATARRFSLANGQQRLETRREC